MQCVRAYNEVNRLAPAHATEEHVFVFNRPHSSHRKRAHLFQYIGKRSFINDYITTTISLQDFGVAFVTEFQFTRFGNLLFYSSVCGGRMIYLCRTERKECMKDLSCSTLGGLLDKQEKDRHHSKNVAHLLSSPKMALASFHLMQTLKNSPAALRRRFRRDRTESLSHGDPLFKVHYLGTKKIFSLDLKQAEDTIDRLLDGCPEKLSKDHALVVRPRYVEVKELSTGRQLTKTYLQDIAYCASHTTRPNVFLYICRQPGQQLQCRVFWCSRAERAKDMTACLARSFQRALNDWQGGCAILPQGDGISKEPEMPGTSTVPRPSTLPASLGKVRWKKRGSVSRSPLRAIARRGSASDSWH